MAIFQPSVHFRLVHSLNNTTFPAPLLFVICFAMPSRGASKRTLRIAYIC
ncbi:hypothetical protein HMPREF1985_02159 [Mitsuokella sp. oral taxon 131 str. W9106]|nr:hypothetical protein HMPREF1985_02159 [Mitsuokella sp. oral taxon 131 str. W9106]